MFNLFSRLLWDELCCSKTSSPLKFSNLFGLSYRYAAPEVFALVNKRDGKEDVLLQHQQADIFVCDCFMGITTSDGPLGKNATWGLKIFNMKIFNINISLGNQKSGDKWRKTQFYYHRCSLESIAKFSPYNCSDLGASEVKPILLLRPKSWFLKILLIESSGLYIVSLYF